MTLDAVVVGGGPAGSMCAARLAAAGKRVCLLEREHHPRFHLGESLLPNCLGPLEAVGVLDEVKARFLVKRGARFVDGADPGRTSRYDFAEAFGARWDHAFQVPRDVFDELLFRNAGARGAELREGWTGTRVVHDGERATGVEAAGPDGQREVLDARFIVDATGREAMTAHAGRDVERIPGLDRTALYTQVRGAWRDTDEREGDIQIIVLGGAHHEGWFWVIPFADGRTSVGAVVSAAWIRARAGLAPEALFDAAVAACPAAARMLVGSTRLFPPRATGDFSFRVRRARGPGWLAVGDATGFIDPLFSTGAHLALNGGLGAADAILGALASGDDALSGGASDATFERWETEMRAGADLFLGMVQAFYAGELTAYLFADPQHPFLRKAMTSLLAGDVFDRDARWTSELRSRFPTRA